MYRMQKKSRIRYTTDEVLQKIFEPSADSDLDISDSEDETDD